MSKENLHHFFSRKASITYDVLEWVFMQGVASGKSLSEGDLEKAKDLENKTYLKIYEMFPERREKTLRWDVVDAAFANHLEKDVRGKVLMEIFRR